MSLKQSKNIHSRKSLTGGLVTGLIFGVASLIIGVIVALVITSTIIDANLVTGDEAGAVNNMSGNFTAGIANVSEQIPTVLLIASIVLILGTLVLLVGAWSRMRLGGGDI